MSISHSSKLKQICERIVPAEAILIGGKFSAATGQQTFPVRDPASGDLLAQVADGNPEAARAAVAAAAAALPAWSRVAPRAKSEILRRTFELMISQERDLALLISAENGKSQADALAEVRYAAEFFRWFSEEAVRINGSYTVAPAGGSRTVVTHRPVGVAALITPWNFPAAMATRKLAPALAAGCTTLLRPASETPLTALAIVHLLIEAGLPEGVVNLIPSSRAQFVSEIWLEDQAVKTISFTGSTRVGRLLMAQAAGRIVTSSMELGGNAPFVVAADADINQAVNGAMLAKFRGGGQACTAANRFYVHAEVVEEFTAKFSAQVEKLTVGPAEDAANQIGPMISDRAHKEVQGLVDEALAQGARLVFQGKAPATGSFMPPTVLGDVPVSASIMHTEIFGPVAPIAVWDDATDLAAVLNDSDFGLASYIFSGDLGWAMQLAEQIEAGMVGINRGLISDPAAPFGGVKESGIGREGGHEGIHEFLETQYFSIAW